MVSEVAHASGSLPGPLSRFNRLGHFAARAVRAAGRWIEQNADGGPAFDRQCFEALARLRDWRPDDLVIDIGANDGRSARRFHRYLGGPRIIACEPVAATFETLCIRTLDLPNVVRLRQGFGSEPGQAVIYVNSSSALSSLDPEWDQAQYSELIPLTTVDRFLADQRIDSVGLLKIDVEGHDLEVLKGSREALAAGRVSIVQVEAGFRAPGKAMPSLDDFQRLLQPLNYQLYGVYNQCRARLQDGRGGPAPSSTAPEILVYCDALFVRTP